MFISKQVFKVYFLDAVDNSPYSPLQGSIFFLSHSLTDTVYSVRVYCTANLGLVFFYTSFVQFSQSDLPPLKPPYVKAPGRDSNPRHAVLIVGTLTDKPPHLPKYS